MSIASASTLRAQSLQRRQHVATPSVADRSSSVRMPSFTAPRISWSVTALQTQTYTICLGRRDDPMQCILAANSGKRKSFLFTFAGRLDRLAFRADDIFGA